MSKLENVQSLRAVAALLVVADHALPFLVGRGAAPEPVLSIAWSLGDQGVGIFFVISGFIMAFTTHDEFGSLASTLRFWRKRLLRIVPLYWAVTGAATLLILAGIWHRPFLLTAGQLAESLFFIPYADGTGPMRPILGPGWTLDYEMMFYAIFGLGLLAPRRIGVGLILGLLAAIVAIGALTFPVSRGIEPQTLLGFVSQPILLLFAAGAGLGWVYAKGWRLPVAAPLAVAGAGIVVSTIVFVAGPFRYPVPLAWHGLLWSLDVLVVAACVFGPRQRLPWLEALGDASYSLYLSHFIVLLVAAKVWMRLGYPLPPLFLPVAMLATVSVGLFIYRWVERPLTASFNRRSDPAPQPA